MTIEEAMTVEEALNILDTIPTISEQVDALEMAIEALEKQMPKKPIEKDTEKPCLFCPNCGVELWVKSHHCKCGQALDFDGYD